MREKLKKLAIYLFLLAFFIPGILGCRIDAQAAGNVGNDTQAAAIRLSKTAATLSPNQSVTLRLNGTTRKPVWTSSNPKVAAVGRTTGKVTAKKEGTAVITAKLGAKTYRCKVTVRARYKILYKSFLGRHTEYDSYYVLNVDKSGVPELVVLTNVSGVIGNYNVYTVANSKLKLLGSYQSMGVSSTNPRFMYVAGQKSLYASGWVNRVGGAWGKLFTISKGKLKETRYAYEEHNRKDVYYTGTSYKSYKKVSKSAYISFCNKYFKNYKSYKMVKNTKYNRNRTFR